MSDRHEPEWLADVRVIIDEHRHEQDEVAEQLARLLDDRDRWEERARSVGEFEERTHAMEVDVIEALGLDPAERVVEEAKAEVRRMGAELADARARAEHAEALLRGQLPDGIEDALDCDHPAAWRDLACARGAELDRLRSEIASLCDEIVGAEAGSTLGRGDAPEVMLEGLAVGLRQSRVLEKWLEDADTADREREIGRRWLRDSSLAAWFPVTAGLLVELERDLGQAQAEIDSLRAMLGEQELAAHDADDYAALRSATAQRYHDDLLAARAEIARLRARVQVTAEDTGRGEAMSIEDLNELADDLDRRHESCSRLCGASERAVEKAQLRGKAVAYGHARDLVRDLVERLAASDEPEDPEHVCESCGLAAEPGD